MTDIVIAAAARTAIGTFNGGLSTVPAHELGATIIQALLERSKVDPSHVSDVILGQVLTAGQGQNPARRAAIDAGLANSSTAMTINQVCGSGLRAIALAMQAIKAGDASIIVAGGQENMSLSPHVMHLRNGVKMGPATMTDTMINDGLWDAFNDYHMGNTAENVAATYSITRDDQDRLAAASQNKAAAAQQQQRFVKEIVPVTVKSRKGDVIVEQDEFIRPGTTAEKLAKLRPAFKKDGSVTAGNASGINDGAAAVLMMTADEANRRGITPMAKVVSWATCGVDPSLMGIGPVAASRQALECAGWSIQDLDLIEANEAFAAQAVAVNKEMAWDIDKVNVNGGAIAIGHPIGASGARILVTLLHEMERRDAKKGLATLCIGGGMGIALCVERS
ncbi:acetyl-CoA C-acetyltransferase [Cohaesibacter celericrescens]|uniref:Beta-ketothiolase n=1 Tax=Cohaesibacter celericrescens TaxID=2067669 RepID=A0A2N5XRM4_9HYPH|nr:acetyl-CoA C-acetyltransferase [Cohaesibacter celericrescens]PLW77115.1 acetyl-CoA C-acyltransferase [Cohaesibacter celericrescens]